MPGILITNLGTPSAPTTRAVRRYLAEFLSDPRVVEIPKLLWQPILHGIVLRTRPAKTAHAYQKIWTAEGSPLSVITKKQESGLNEIFSRQQASVTVVSAMRYGSPSIADGLEKLRQANVDKIIVFPLYPQYSAATTRSTLDVIEKTLKKWRWFPEIQSIAHYADHPDYIATLAASVQNFWQNNSRGQKLLFSFHGLPQRNIDCGDPYFSLCQKTTALLVEKLNLKKDEWLLTFQSRFGYQPWLQPYCDKTLQQLAQKGYKNIDIICPGFSADCLETLEEISIRNRNLFIQAGGDQLNYIPALNDTPQHLQALTNIIQSYL